MKNMFTTKPAVFLKFESLGILFFVFGAAIIYPTTLSAFELYIFTHFF